MSGDAAAKVGEERPSFLRHINLHESRLTTHMSLFQRQIEMGPRQSAAVPPTNSYVVDQGTTLIPIHPVFERIPLGHAANEWSMRQWADEQLLQCCASTKR
jgi:hypothetical protein